MQNVLITGAGRPQALGFNLVKRYLEHGDRVFACVRKSTDSFTELLRMYPGELTVLVMDIADTPSVRAASEAIAVQVDRLDTIINNAVTTASDCNASHSAHRGSEKCQNVKKPGRLITCPSRLLHHEQAGVGKSGEQGVSSVHGASVCPLLCQAPRSVGRPASPGENANLQCCKEPQRERGHADGGCDHRGLAEAYQFSVRIYQPGRRIGWQ